jgi:hypothetical protein
MEDINDYIKEVEKELNEIQATVGDNPELAEQYESRLIELIEQLTQKLIQI